MWLWAVWLLLFLDFARAVAARPISYAAVLRMKQDGSSSVLNPRSRPRQHLGGGLASPDWPAFSSHPLSALSLLSSQEDNRSGGKIKVAVENSLCLLLSEPQWKSSVFWLVKFTFTLKNTVYKEGKTSLMVMSCFSTTLAKDNEHKCTLKNTIFNGAFIR